MNETKRFYLLDVLRILTLMAIATLHANEFVFYLDDYPLRTEAPIHHYAQLYSRFFTIGGQILVALIFLLFGLSQKSKKNLFSISIFALIGQLVLTVVFQTFEWDIYIYLATVSAMIAIVPYFYRFHWPNLFLSFLILWIPTNFLQSFAGNSEVLSILTGKITNTYSGSWPLLPQFFLALLFYQLGLYVHSHRNKFKIMKSIELLIWGFILLGSVPFLGAYYDTPIGPRYYEFVFNQPPYVFWANFSVFVFIMRISFLDFIQSKLERSFIIRWIGQLAWNRHLGFTYLISIIYLGLGMYAKDYFYRHPSMFELYFVSLMPISELVARFIIKFSRK